MLHVAVTRIWRVAMAVGHGQKPGARAAWREVRAIVCAPHAATAVAKQRRVLGCQSKLDSSELEISPTSI